MLTVRCGVNLKNCERENEKLDPKPEALENSEIRNPKLARDHAPASPFINTRLYRLCENSARFFSPVFPAWIATPTTPRTCRSPRRRQHAEWPRSATASYLRAPGAPKSLGRPVQLALPTAAAFAPTAASKAVIPTRFNTRRKLYVRQLK